MIRLGLIGYPLQHSLSPVLHHAALRASGLQGTYELHAVGPDDTASVGELVDGVRRGEIQGLNVTIPYKQTVLTFLDGLTPAAEAIGAVNTIYLQDGKAIGENTDFAGFLADLRAWMSIPRSSMVLGAGGAARAVIYALGTMGCKVDVLSRRAAGARQLAHQFASVSAVELNRETLQALEPDLVVNATPAGMFPDFHECAWPAGLSLPRKAAIYDLVYNPPETLLIKKARLAGLRTRNGRGMLIEQALLAFEVWTGCTAPRSTLAEAIGQPAD